MRILRTRSLAERLTKAFLLPFCAWLLVLGAVPAGSQAGAPQGATRYLLTELSGLGEGVRARAVWTDPATGDWYAAGSSSHSGSISRHAVLWQNGQPMDLGSLGITGEVTGLEVVQGEPVVVGYRSTGAPAYEIRAFAWQNGQMSDLSNAGRNDCRAADVESGVIVGSSEVAAGITSATTWSGGQLSDVEASPIYSSTATAIDGGVVVGYFNRRYTGPRFAALWKDGVRTDLGTLGGMETWAYDVAVIGDSPSVVGEANLPFTSRKHAYVWRDGTMTDLGTLGGETSVATAINHRGQIVGAASIPHYGVRAAIWQDGTVANLNDLVLNAENAVLYTADAIDDHGRILASGRRSGDNTTRSFLLIPVTVTDPPPVIQSITPTEGKQGSTLNVLLTGTGFTPTSTVDFGSGLQVNGVTYAEDITAGATSLKVNVTIPGDAALGLRTVRVTNPDLQWDVVEQGFNVVAGPSALYAFRLIGRTTVRGGEKITGHVQLSRPVTTRAGAFVTFSSSNPAFKPPKRVRIPRGQISPRRPFVYRTKRVRTPTSYTVTATYGGVSRSVEVTLLPR